jgi:acetyl-CoA/propionyl-CoA carboxylase, biotin carboxylase, biotin carboxyl carrier protein
VLERLLVANRGEIARRVLRTCARLGIATVAIHSDADAGEPHVREADTAVRIGPAPAAASYLAIDRIVAAALESGCDGVHPGYGFLAENAAFARAVTEAGLTFVGPSAEVIGLMGDKAAAKRRLAAAGVPVVPGDDRDELTDAELLVAARDLGAPLLVKAVAGGGGKGMRTVHDLADLPGAIAAARREAAAAFDDERVILERLVSDPRHIEIQVMGDRHGEVIHLLERECSIQRRHQKVVEESPSPAVDAALRDRMGSAAVAAARAVGYEGAGTVEFLVAGDTLSHPEPAFYFLEMNTRLQVEHPVTELITGLDLVELQLRVAAGEPLGIRQDEVRAEGHALEVRLYAEDPVTQLPQTGRVERFHVPQAPDVRIDSGIETGSEVTRFYDPMVAKLLVHTPDRATSCERMSWLLAHTTLHGVVTNLDLLAAVVAHPVFRSGEITTGFIDHHLGDLRPPPATALGLVAGALTLAAGAAAGGPPGDPCSPWDTLGPFRLGQVGGWHVTLVSGADRHELVLARRTDRDRVSVDGVDHAVRVLGGPTDDGELHLELDGVAHPTRTTSRTDPHGAGVVWVHADGLTRRLQVLPATHHADASALAGAAACTSPMPGAVLAVHVTPGRRVAAGTAMVVVEAMKMEHPVIAPADGVVTDVLVAVGDAVDAGTTLVTFEATESDATAPPLA